MRSISIILLIALFTLTGTVGFGKDKTSSIAVQLHTEKAVPHAGFSIKFVEMVEDSRCPAGTNCVWAGNAKVKIIVRQGRHTRTFELNDMTQPTVVNYGGYDIKLTALTPKPGINVRINPDKYMATFEVVKHKGK